MTDCHDRAQALALDAADPLASLREQFELPPGLIYLDGNSLGVLPRATAARVQQVVTQEWGAGLIRSWNSAGWMELPQRVGARWALGQFGVDGRRLGEQVGFQTVVEPDFAHDLGDPAALQPQE